MAQMTATYQRKGDNVVERTGNGEVPALQIQGKVTCRDFCKAYFIARKNISPIHLPQVQAGLCLTGAVLFASLIPLFQLFFFNMTIPLVAIVLFLALTLFFLLLFPSLSRSRGEAIFSSNQTLGLPRRLSFYPSYLLLENEYESVQEYWTDMELSLENSKLFILKGGKEKPLIVIPKSDLTADEQQALSEWLSNQLVHRHRRSY